MWWNAADNMDVRKETIEKTVPYVADVCQRAACIAEARHRRFLGMLQKMLEEMRHHSAWNSHVILDEFVDFGGDVSMLVYLWCTSFAYEGFLFIEIVCIAVIASLLNWLFFRIACIS